MQDVIVKKNGEPYASEAVARQQRSAMYMEKTHDVVPHEGGYGLQIKSAEPITLRPGDYVSTEGMTEDQYHAVAKAFEYAGCPRFNACVGKGVGYYLEWYKDNLVSTYEPEDGGRHLTIDQVLGATNSGQQQEDDDMPSTTVIDTLHAAERQLLDAQEALRSAEAVFNEAMDAVREELGGSFTLTHEAGAVAQDLPPEEWREGDLVECIESPHGWWTVGGEYKIERFDNDGWPCCYDNDGDVTCIRTRHLKFLSRPAK